MPTIHTAANAIIAWAWTDSRIRIDKQKLMRALEIDEIACAGRYPTDDECEELVTGGDDGEPDPCLCELFKETNALLASYWE